MKPPTAGHAKRWRISTLPLPALLVAALAVGGCGSTKGTTTATTESTPATSSSQAAATTTGAAAPTATTDLSLEANPEGQLKYNTSTLTAKAGKVTIDFKNMSPLGHNVTVEAPGGKTLGATPTFQGASKSLTLDLKPGTYKFYCSVPGHRMAGMEGTLVVR